ncbi:hypothetical protein LV476_01905 [Guyparkeria hydrothermalis]|uniref:hypothetical protein n=1 Tax=Guyparkeria hydrothermalis TaxID=923 RepID=UPI0020212872|nr:hypothetical protein [Guyparkeria hydrothermalis]MCL7743706.1 hypothetical protein [Guyparkeria hydrothermalis]
MTFVAFVASDSTGHLIREGVGRLGEVVDSRELDLERAIRFVDATAPSVVFVEFSMQSQWLRYQESLVQGLVRHKPFLPVIAVGENDSRHLLLSALRSGATDFLMPSADLDEFNRRIEAVTERLPRHPFGSEARGHAQMTVVVGARPDEDAALFTEHLAMQIQRGLGEDEDCLILDVGFPANDVLTILGLRAEYSLVDAIRNVHSIDGLLVDTAFPRHDSGVRVLGVGDDLDGLAELQPPDVMLFLDALHYYFKHVVINLSGVADIDFIQTFSKRADRIFLLGTQTITSFRANEQLLKELNRVGGMQGKVELVLDRYEKRSLPSAKLLAERLELPLAATLPVDWAARLEVVNSGETFMERFPRSGYTQAIRSLAKRVRGEPAASKSGLGGLLTGVIGSRKGS